MSLLLVESSKSKPAVLHLAEFLDDGLGQLAVCGPVVVDLHEHEVKLAIQVVLVVPPLFEVLRENEVLLLDNLAEERYLARPASLFGSSKGLVGDVLAYVIEVFVAATIERIHQPVLASHERNPLGVVFFLRPLSGSELISILSDGDDLLLHSIILCHILL